MKEELYTLDQVANSLGVSRRVASNLIARSNVPINYEGITPFYQAKNGDFNFLLGLTQTPISEDFDIPQLVPLEVNVTISDNPRPLLEKHSEEEFTDQNIIKEIGDYVKCIELDYSDKRAVIFNLYFLRLPFEKAVEHKFDSGYESDVLDTKENYPNKVYREITRKTDKHSIDDKILEKTPWQGRLQFYNNDFDSVLSKSIMLGLDSVKKLITIGNRTLVTSLYNALSSKIDKVCVDYVKSD